MHIEEQGIASSADEILVAGSPVLVAANGNYLGARVDSSAAGGAFVDRQGLARLFPVPSASTELYAPVIARDGKANWLVVWLERSSSRQGSRVGGRVLAAMFDGKTWGAPEVVVDSAFVVWGPGAVSPLQRTTSGFALATAVQSSANTNGGVLLLIRAGARWTRRIVATGTGADAGYAALQASGDTILIAYTTGDASFGGGANALYVRRSPNGGRTWGVPIRFSGHDAAEPKFVSAGPGELALLWKQNVGNEADSGAKEFVAFSGNFGGTWTQGLPVDRTDGVNTTSVADMANHTGFVAVEVGGALQRQLRLFRVDHGKIDLVLDESIEAATRVLITSVKSNELQLAWSRGDAVANGVLPASITQRITVRCSESRER